MRIPECDVKLVDSTGGSIAYSEFGNPDHPSLIFLHGSGPGVSGMRNFGEVVFRFSDSYHCIILEFPGFGISSPREGHPVLNARNSCVELMDALGIESAHLVGNSMGAIVAAGLAALHPQRVNGLVALGGLGQTVFSPRPAEGIRLLTDFLENPQRDSLTRWLRAMLFDQTLLTEELIETRLRQATEHNALETLRRLYDDMAIQEVAAGEVAVPLSRVQAPTLLVYGRDDRVTPVDMALQPMREMPHAELHIVPNCGHWVMIEQKDIFVGLVREFLGRFSRSPAEDCTDSDDSEVSR